MEDGWDSPSHHADKAKGPWPPPGPACLPSCPLPNVPPRFLPSPFLNEAERDNGSLTVFYGLGSVCIINSFNPCQNTVFLADEIEAESLRTLLQVTEVVVTDQDSHTGSLAPKSIIQWFPKCGPWSISLTWEYSRNANSSPPPPPTPPELLSLKLGGWGPSLVCSQAFRGILST